MRDTIEFLQAREKIIERKLKRKNLPKGRRKELRQTLQLTRWQVLKLTLLINMKGGEI